MSMAMRCSGYPAKSDCIGALLVWDGDFLDMHFSQALHQFSTGQANRNVNESFQLFSFDQGDFQQMHHGIFFRILRTENFTEDACFVLFQECLPNACTERTLSLSNR